MGTVVRIRDGMGGERVWHRAGVGWHGTPATVWACAQNLLVWKDVVGRWWVELEGQGVESLGVVDTQGGMATTGHRHAACQDGKHCSWVWPVWHEGLTRVHIDRD